MAVPGTTRVVVEGQPGWNPGMLAGQLREVLVYRTLLLELVRKDLRGKYKRSSLGIIWSLLNPLLLMLVYTLVFSTIARFPVKNYPMLLLSGLLAWNFLSNALSQSVTAIVNNANLVRKIYFPREVLVASLVGASLVNFVISLLLLVPFILLFRVQLGWPVLLLPLLLLTEVLFVGGLSLLVSAVDVFFRDIEHLIQVLLLVWFFATPVIYPYSSPILSARVRAILLVNPLTWLMDSYQRILYWNLWPRPEFIAGFAAAAMVVALLGALSFQRLKRSFAEEV